MRRASASLPLCYPLVVAGQQHVGDWTAFPLARFGVERIFKQSRFEALVGEAFG